MEHSGSTRGAERIVDIEDAVSSAAAHPQTLAPIPSTSPPAATTPTASQYYTGPRTPSEPHMLLVGSSTSSSSSSQSIRPLLRARSEHFVSLPFPSDSPSGFTVLPRPFSSLLSNGTGLPTLRPLANLSESYAPQSAGQRVIFLRRYIQDTMHKIEYTTGQLNNISRCSREYERGFSAFAKLPMEIQHLVWDHAVPNARKISNSILVIVNHNLSDPKAILPKPKEYKKIYGDIFARTIQAAADDGHDMELDPYDFRWDVSKHMVFSMMQTCHNSRVAAMKRFCLDVEYPNPGAVRKLPWSDEDIIYFPCQGFSFERRMAMQWLSRKREAPPPSLATIQNIALPLERILLQAFGITRVFLGRHPGRNQWDNAWLKNLPNLKSFGLYLDPGDVSEKEEGELRLYEPEDVPVFYCSRYTPSEAEAAVTDKLNGLKGSDRMDIVAEASVLCWKKPKWSTARSGTTVAVSPPNDLGSTEVSLVVNPSSEESSRLLQLLITEAPGSDEHLRVLRQLQEHLNAVL